MPVNTQEVGTEEVNKPATTAPAPKNQKNIFANTWVRIAIGLVGLALIGLGLFKILGPSDKVSDEFIDKYNEIAALAQEIADASTVDLEGLEAKESAGDYKGAIAIVDGAADQTDALVKKVDKLVTKLSELKTLAADISDSDVRASALKLIALLEENNGHVYKLLDYSEQLLGVLGTYYRELDAGTVPTVPDITGIVNNVDVEAAAVEELATKIEAAKAEFTKLAEIKEVD